MSPPAVFDGTNINTSLEVYEYIVSESKRRVRILRTVRAGFDGMVRRMRTLRTDHQALRGLGMRLGLEHP